MVSTWHCDEGGGYDKTLIQMCGIQCPDQQAFAGSVMASHMTGSKTVDGQSLAGYRIVPDVGRGFSRGGFQFHTQLIPAEITTQWWIQAQTDDNHPGIPLLRDTVLGDPRPTVVTLGLHGNNADVSAADALGIGLHVRISSVATWWLHIQSASLHISAKIRWRCKKKERKKKIQIQITKPRKLCSPSTSLNF